MLLIPRPLSLRLEQCMRVGGPAQRDPGTPRHGTPLTTYSSGTVFAALTHATPRFAGSVRLGRPARRWCRAAGPSRPPLGPLALLPRQREGQGPCDRQGCNVPGKAERQRRSPPGAARLHLLTHPGPQRPACSAGTRSSSGRPGSCPPSASRGLAATAGAVLGCSTPCGADPLRAAPSVRLRPLRDAAYWERGGGVLAPHLATGEPGPPPAPRPAPRPGGRPRLPPYSPSRWAPSAPAPRPSLPRGPAESGPAAGRASAPARPACPPGGARGRPSPVRCLRVAAPGRRQPRAAAHGDGRERRWRLAGPAGGRQSAPLLGGCQAQAALPSSLPRSRTLHASPPFGPGCWAARRGHAGSPAAPAAGCPQRGLPCRPAGRPPPRAARGCGRPALGEEGSSWELVAAGKPPVVVQGVTSG